MDIISNIRAFLTVARLGSFSAAAREGRTVPSVISKRISHLEHELKTQLFLRSTRGLQLTEAGLGYQQRFMTLLGELDAAIEGSSAAAGLQEHIRIKCPATMEALGLASTLIEFRAANPGVRIDMILVDRTVNPLEEGYDLALGAMPVTFPHVVDVPLAKLPRKAVAAKSFIDRHGMPEHPRDLASLPCITVPVSGTRWAFEGPSGEVAVEVGSVFSATDSRILRDAVLAGIGVTVLSEYLVRPGLKSGELVEILPGYHVPDLFMKLLVPESRMTSPTIRAIVDCIVSATQPVPPWDRV